MRTADWTDSVSVLDRVTAVFEAFGEHDEGLGVSELARRANLPKSTVSRIAADLVEQRFLDRDGDKLYLGVRLFELGPDRRAAAQAPPARASGDDRAARRDRPDRPSRGARGNGRRLHRDRPRRVRRRTPAGAGRRAAARARDGARKGHPGVLAAGVVERIAYGGLERRTPHTICRAVGAPARAGGDPPERDGRRARGVRDRPLLHREPHPRSRRRAGRGDLRDRLGRRDRARPRRSCRARRGHDPEPIGSARGRIH